MNTGRMELPPYTLYWFNISEACLKIYYYLNHPVYLKLG